MRGSWVRFPASSPADRGCSRSMPIPLATWVDAAAIVPFQEGLTRLWHGAPRQPARDGALEALIEAQHAANFTLWHAEDEARRLSADDASIAAGKREIDRGNRAR